MILTLMSSSLVPCIAIVTPKSDAGNSTACTRPIRSSSATFNCPWIYVAFV